MADPRIGVFLCACDDESAGLVDMAALAGRVQALPGVACCESGKGWCSPGALERMRAAVLAQGVDRVLIGACAARTHRRLFCQALEGLVPPASLVVLNLRDLCLRPHRQAAAEAAAKAYDQIAMAVADLALRTTGGLRVVEITPAVVVVGGGIAGLTAALAISDSGLPVTLVERGADLGGLADSHPPDAETADVVAERVAAVRSRAGISVLTNVEPVTVIGPVGRYQVALRGGGTGGSSILAGASSAEQLLHVEAGAIILATGAVPATAVAESDVPVVSTAFVLCDITPRQADSCQHACCLLALRRAAETRRLNPGLEVSVLFRELYTAGGAHSELVWEAQRLGVRFVRYPAGACPRPVDGAIAVHDELTGADVTVACQRVVWADHWVGADATRNLAAALWLPVDESGFVADVRQRLRPEDRLERGIFVCGGAHLPCDSDRAVFEGLSAGAQAVQHLRRGRISTWATAAAVDTARCNGCGDCVRACPFLAVNMVERPSPDTAVVVADGQPRLATVDELVCTGCGTCASVCPVGAASVSDATDKQLFAQVSAALNVGGGTRGASAAAGGGTGGAPLPRVLVFACEWSGYSAAEIAGARGLPYPAATRVIRLKCAGRLQPGLILSSLELGAAGVLVLGCPPGTCHHEEGSARCAAVMEQAAALARLLSVEHRLKAAWVAADDEAGFAKVATEFSGSVGCDGAALSLEDRPAIHARPLGSC